MQDSLPNTIQGYSQIPITAVLIAGCVALWKSVQKQGSFLSEMLTAQQQSSKEQTTAIQQIARESTIAIQQMNESNNRVVVAIQGVHDEISELRTQLAQRPCIVPEINAAQSHRKSRGTD